MKIRFNMQETIQREYELDELDSEKVHRRAKEIKDASRVNYGMNRSVHFYYMCAIQELLREDRIVADLVSRDSETDITSAWIEEEEEDS
jgi:hypothetical protein